MQLSISGAKRYKCFDRVKRYWLLKMYFKHPVIDSTGNRFKIGCPVLHVLVFKILEDCQIEPSQPMNYLNYPKT